jgi:hypothetical protein
MSEWGNFFVIGSVVWGWVRGSIVKNKNTIYDKKLLEDGLAEHVP